MDSLFLGDYKLKGTAYDPALLVLVMLVSRNVFSVVSALQSTAFIHIFILADQISGRSYVGSVYRMQPLALYSHSFMNFPTVGLFRSDMLRS